MFNFAQRRRYYFLFSASVIIPGIIAMIISTATYSTPIRVSIDFTGGSLLEIPLVDNVGEQQVRDSLSEFGLKSYTVQRLDPKSVVGDQANSRWTFTVPGDTQVTDLEAYLQDQGGLGDLWSPDSTKDDPTRTSAVGVTPLDDGSLQIDISFVNDVSDTELSAALANFGLADITATPVVNTPGSRWQIRLKELDPDQENALKAFLQDPSRLGPIWTPNPNNPDSAVSSSHVSATVGKEVTRAAFIATLAVAVIILGFIVLAFRRVPHAFRYGACAIAAMFHDILVTMGVMAILGLIFNWEADALFLTAILTVVGYSVQDTIVVFDRIRENIPKYRGEDYETIVNRSVLQTIHRSLATQLNAIFVMVAILLFGGETIKQFIGIMLIGLMSGTYSSIFNAVPLLISWEKGEIPFVNREAKRRREESRATL
jgi:preprotein translocase subunit SecF